MLSYCFDDIQENEPFEKYKGSATQIKNIFNLIRYIETHDKTVELDSSYYHILGRPPYINRRINTDGEVSYVIDFSDNEILLNVFKRALILSFDTSIAAINQIITEIYEIYYNYDEGIFSGTEGMLRLQYLYGLLLYTTQQSNRDVARLAGVSINEELYKKQIAEIIHFLINFNALATAEDKKTSSIINQKNNSIRTLNDRLTASENHIGDLQKTVKNERKFHHDEIKRYKLDLLREQNDRQAWNNDRLELADLRELIFLFDNNRDAELEDCGIAFPYSINQTIYVIGGYESWVKQMKEFLPGLRYVRDVNIKLDDKIAHADQVWFQVNALSHSRYYEAIKLSDKHRIQIHYFKYNSAKSCAVQFVQAQL